MNYFGSKPDYSIVNRGGSIWDLYVPTNHHDSFSGYYRNVRSNNEEGVFVGIKNGQVITFEIITSFPVPKGRNAGYSRKLIFIFDLTKSTNVNTDIDSGKEIEGSYGSDRQNQTETCWIKRVLE